MKKFFSLLWQGWKKFAHALGVVNTRILLTITYFLIIAIAAIIMRLLGRDLLDRRWRKAESYWHQREALDTSLEAAKRQF